MYSPALRNSAPPERAKAFFGYVALVCVVALALVIPALPELRGVPVHSAGGVLAAGRCSRWWPTCGRSRPRWSADRSSSRPSVSPSRSCSWGLRGRRWPCRPPPSSRRQLRMQHRPWRAAFNIAQYAIAFGAAAAVLLATGATPFAPGGEPGWTDVGLARPPPASGSSSTMRSSRAPSRLRFGGSWWRALGADCADDALTTGSLLLLAPVLVGATRASAALIPLVLVPLFAVNRMARLRASRSGPRGPTR